MTRETQDWLYEVAEEGTMPTGFGRCWVIGYADDGEFYVRSLFRDARRDGEPWWTKRYRPRRHWLFYLWTRVKGGVAWIEAA